MFWPAEGRLLDVRDEDSANEYEMPLPAAEHGASRDPAPVLPMIDVGSAYLRARLAVTFDAVSVALGVKSRTADADGGF